jgi:alpha-tubulin suppressor-like RCC1 family protein
MCGALVGGGVQCAGSNGYGQLGNNGGGTAPVSGLSNVTIDAIAAGQAHTCALDNEGTVHCWGDNDDGELGDGTTTTRFVPVTVQPW